MKRALLSGILLLACVLVLHGEVLFGGGVRLALDQRMYPPWAAAAGRKGERLPDPIQGVFNRLSTDSNFWYEGQILLARKMVRRGLPPSWDPWTQGGTPLAAQLGVPLWYPPFWILFLGPPLAAVGWLAAFHMLLAGILAWRLVRFLGGSPWAACLSGVAFGIGPWMAFRENNMTLLAAAAWAPLAFEAAGRTASGGKPVRWALVLAFALALGLWAGMPQLGFVTLWGSLAFGLLGLRRASSRRRRVFLLGGAFLAGLLLAAPALLPTYRLYRNSIRSGEEAPRTQRLGLPPGALLGLLSPEILGSASDLAGWERFEDFPPARKFLTGDPQDNPLEDCLYPGAAVLLLVFLLLAAGRKDRGEGRRLPKGAGFFLVTAASALLLSLRLPPLDPLFRIPGLGPEDPRRVLLLFHLGLAVAGGLALDRLSLSRPPFRLLLPLLLAPALLFLGGWVFPAAGEGALGLLFGPLEPGEARPLLLFERAALLGPALAAAWSALSLLLMPRLGKAGKAAILGGLVLECLLFALRTNPAPPMAQVEALGTTRTEKALLELARKAGPQGPPRLLHVRCFHALQGNLVTPQGIPAVSTTHPLPLRRFARRMELVEKTLVDPSLPRGIAWLRNPRSCLHPLLASARIGLFCCDDPETASELEALGLERVFPPPGKEALNEGVALFASPRTGPRARMVFSWKEVSSVGEAARVLAAGKGLLPVEPARPLPEPVPPGRPPRIRWILSNPGTIYLEVDTGGGRGILVIADCWYPGWMARVDGRRVPVFPADLAFMGIYLEPGRHRIELSFRDPDRIPRILLLGAAAGVLALLALFGSGKPPGARGWRS